MMSWNYRIVRYKDGSGYGLHEVFYDSEGMATNMTAEPITFFADVEEGRYGLVRSLQMAYDDATKRPVFDEPEVWEGGAP